MADQKDGAVKNELRQKSVVELVQLEDREWVRSRRYGRGVQQFFQQCDPSSGNQTDGSAGGEMRDPGEEAFPLYSK